MENRGLQSSRWAQESSRRVPQSRSSDWTCPTCGFENFAWRKDCFRCPPSSASGGDHGRNIEITSRQPTPLHERSKESLMQGNEHSNIIRLDTTVTDPLQDPRLFNGERGLTTSRWAPRNQAGRCAGANSGQVWTRVVSASNPTPNSHAQDGSLRMNSPGLGLPYEVQHFILTMMQRILEEGTYAFAVRWIPSELEARRWNCSEAVELSTWREILPDTVPLKSIVPIPNYTLAEALRDAVKVRNAAAHRHLCDNTEIRHMALRAQDLMAMFSDVTRQNKFDQVRQELSAWDAVAEQDMQAAQEKLQRALQEINERPLDDMDWTPNTVSLQELTPEVHPRQDLEESAYDEMDLDMD